MSMTVQNTDSAILRALVVAFNNKLRGDVLAGSAAHNDVSSVPNAVYPFPSTTPLTVGHANPTNLATLRTAVEAIRKCLLVHFEDAPVAGNPLSAGAHNAIDTTNAALIDYTAFAELTSASTLADCEAVLNACKSAYSTGHCADTTVHANADATNTIAAPNGTDLATSLTLAIEMIADIDAHILLAGPGQLINVA